MEKIYKDGEVLEATDLNNSFSELEAKINALALQKMPLPPLSDGVTASPNSGFEIYKYGNLVIFQGSLSVAKTIASGNFFATPLPRELCPKRQVWFSCTSYSTPRNLYITPEGHLKTAGIHGSKELIAGWYELGSVKYLIDPTPQATTQATEQPLEES